MKTALFLVMLCLANFSNAQVGIGTSTPNSNAALDVTSNNKGLLLPRLSDTSNVSNPSAGLLIYNMSTQSPAFHNGNNWSSIGTATAAGTNTDSVTYTLASSSNGFTIGTFRALTAAHGLVATGGPAAGFQEIYFTLPFDVNSTAFAKAVAGSVTLPTIEIKFYTRGSSTPYFSLKGTTVKITSFQVSANPPDATFTEDISFSAVIYGFKDWVNNLSFGWNTSTNVATTY